MKKIALIIKNIHGGGAEKVCLWLARNLSDNTNYKVELIVLSGVLGEVVSTDGNLTVITPCFKRTINSSFFIARTMLQRRYDLIICFGYEILVISAFIKRCFFLDTKIILRNINSVSRELFSNNSIYRRYIARPIIIRFLGLSDYVINQCNGMQEDFLSTIRFLQEKCFVINNPAYINNSSTLTARSIAMRADGNYFVFAGRLEKQKRVDLLLTSYSIYRNHGGRALLIILGDGSLKSELRHIAEKLGIDKFVNFCGFISDAKIYLNGAIATLLTSEYEGFPNILLESISLGTPVISFDCPYGPAEIIINKRNGILVDFQDVNSFARAMLRIEVEEINRTDVALTSDSYSSSFILGQYVSMIEDIT